MRPVLFEIPLGFKDIPVHAYGFFIMLGFVVGSWIAAKRAPKVDVSPEFTLDLSLWVMIAGIVGSRVFYVAQYYREFDWRIFDLSGDGLSFLGLVVGWTIPLVRLALPAREMAPPAPGQPLWVLRLIWYLMRRKDPRSTGTGLLGTLLWTVAACCVLGILFGRGVYLFEHRMDPRFDYGVFKIWNGGIVFYGGLFGAVAVAFWYIRRHRQSIAVISDLFIPEVALGYAFARVGCFLNGCCFGHPTTLPWAITYPGPSEALRSGSPAWEAQVKEGIISQSAEVSKAVHPSQLYATVAAVVIFFLLSRIWRTNKVPGRVLGWFLLLYPIYRFLAELTRGDEAHDWFGLTISQFISVCMFAVGLLYLYILSRRAAPAPEPIAAVSDRR